MENVPFILLAMTYDNTRADRGLYHHPKLLHADALKRALQEKFGSKAVTSQNDPDGDAVAHVVTLPVSLSDTAALDVSLTQTFNNIKEIAGQVSGTSQHLHLFIQGSVARSLQRCGATTELFHHIAAPPPPGVRPS
jgi:hypothetical protein